ncbi:cadherin-like beta sandwich domain-containing protein [Cohnella sp. GCM10027633]|uniref:cadherin-like beta sandwich domain-containing protein n=1 Tax=unclassified Cohnella TaxID=2636738 RepID=UPI0036451E74
MRKGIIYVLTILLVSLSWLGTFTAEASAATSRVAVIKELKGTVKVKKNGGSKEFTAFAKMSLNEGDVLAVGSGGTAVLQFANGTTEDDKMTVASDTKLTFSKLSNAKGTTTKVSMWKGSAWVDVKSIANADDQFTLETPTAVMGVRGTHLLVNVDPATGATRLTVAAGIVTTSAPGGGGDSQNVYPTQNALITGGDNAGQEDAEIAIAPADLELLMKQSDASLIEAILLAAADITAENEQYVERYENGETPGEIGGTATDLARFKSNTENLLGAIADQALKSGLVDQERLNKIVEAVKSQSGFTVDLTKKTLQTTQEEELKKAKQREVEENQRLAAEQAKAKEQEQRDKQAELLRKIEEARLAAEKAKQAAEEEKKRKALDAYEKQLDAAAKARFESEKKEREQETAAQNAAASPSASASASPSSSPSTSPNPSPVTDPSGNLSSNANLSNLAVSNGQLTFISGKTQFMMEVGSHVSSLSVTPTVADSSATVKVNGTAVASGTASGAINLTAGTNTYISVEVRAADGSTKTYTLSVYRTVPMPATLFSLSVNQQWVSGFTSGSGTSSYTVVVANDAQSITINASASDYMNTTVTGTGIKTLAAGNNSFDVTVTSTDGTQNIYTLNIVRAMLSGIALERLSSDGFWVSMSSRPFDSYSPLSMDWPLAHERSKVRFTPLLIDDGTEVHVNNEPYYGGPIEATLVEGPNNFIITTLAADGETNLTYTLKLYLDEAQSIPRTVTSWTTTTNVDSSTPIEWEYVDVGENIFSTKVSGDVSSFTTTLQFKESRGITSAKLFRKGENGEESVPIATWNESGISQTITGINPGLNQYALRFYSGSYDADYFTLNVVSGDEDPIWTAFGNVTLVDEDRFALLDSPIRSGELSYFTQVASNVSRVNMDLPGKLYLDGMPVKPVYDGSRQYIVNLETDYNQYEVVVKDPSGQFVKTYTLTIFRGEEVPSELTLNEVPPYMYELASGIDASITNGAESNDFNAEIGFGADGVMLVLSHSEEAEASVYYEDASGTFHTASGEGDAFQIPTAVGSTKVTIVLRMGDQSNVYRVFIYRSTPPLYGLTYWDLAREDESPVSWIPAIGVPNTFYTFLEEGQLNEMEISTQFSFSDLVASYTLKDEENVALDDSSGWLVLNGLEPGENAFRLTVFPVGEHLTPFTYTFVVMTGSSTAFDTLELEDAESTITFERVDNYTYTAITDSDSATIRYTIPSPRSKVNVESSTVHAGVDENAREIFIGQLNAGWNDFTIKITDLTGYSEETLIKIWREDGEA